MYGVAVHGSRSCNLPECSSFHTTNPPLFPPTPHPKEKHTPTSPPEPRRRASVTSVPRWSPLASILPRPLPSLPLPYLTAAPLRSPRRQQQQQQQQMTPPSAHPLRCVFPFLFFFFSRRSSISAGDSWERKGADGGEVGVAPLPAILSPPLLPPSSRH